jgi:hypothetical protein
MEINPKAGETALGYESWDFELSSNSTTADYMGLGNSPIFF